jgi:2-polyprenyl-3-methyl-5-hydroxy-6-metoxy-1,4-benzoquinol methylase
MSTAQLNELVKPATTTRPQTSPEKLFETLTAYQRTEALKAAIELDLFTAVGQGIETIPELAERVRASERGLRALCNYMVVIGFLSKAGERFSLTANSSMFLDKQSPAYAGFATRFLASASVTENFRDLATVVRTGKPLSGEALTKPEHPAWVDFARFMAPLLLMVAGETEKLVRKEAPMKVLDVAAGHGMFGITLAQQNHNAKIVALDWPSVLVVAKENAQRMGVVDRYTLLPGDAFEVPFGAGFDCVLVPNFLHHWDRAAIHKFLSKVHAALAPAGQIVIVEFVPNEDRVSPPVAAGFALTMLANTLGGDCYTASEYREMLRQVGFSNPAIHPLPPTPHSAMIANKR